jgi:hypothetical protein
VVEGCWDVGWKRWVGVVREKRDVVVRGLGLVKRYRFCRAWGVVVKRERVCVWGEGAEFDVDV